MRPLPIIIVLAFVALGAFAFFGQKKPVPLVAEVAPEPEPAPAEPEPVVAAEPEVKERTSEPSRKWSKEDREKGKKRMEFMLSMMGISEEQQAELEERMEMFKELDKDQQKMVGEAFKEAFSEGTELRKQAEVVGKSMRSGTLNMFDLGGIYDHDTAIKTADTMLLSAETYDQDGINDAVQTGYGTFLDGASEVVKKREAEAAATPTAE